MQRHPSNPSLASVHNLYTFAVGFGSICSTIPNIIFPNIPIFYNSVRTHFHFISEYKRASSQSRFHMRCPKLSFYLNFPFIISCISTIAVIHLNSERIQLLIQRCPQKDKKDLNLHDRSTAVLT
jgi:hypothetical protein